MAKCKFISSDEMPSIVDDCFGTDQLVDCAPGRFTIMFRAHQLFNVFLLCFLLQRINFERVKGEGLEVGRGRGGERERERERGGGRGSLLVSMYKHVRRGGGGDCRIHPN